MKPKTKKIKRIKAWVILNPKGEFCGASHREDIAKVEAMEIDENFEVDYRTKRKSKVIPVEVTYKI